MAMASTKKKKKNDINERSVCVKILGTGLGRPRKTTILASDAEKNTFPTDIASGSAEKPSCSTTATSIYSGFSVNEIEMTEDEGSAYSKRRATEDAQWANLRSKLLKIHLEGLAPSEACTRCKKQFSESPIKCIDCGQNAFFCKECFSHFHDVLNFHRPYIWNGVSYAPFIYVNRLSKRNCSCDAIYDSNVVVFDRKGLSYACIVTTCLHEDLAETLLRNGIWPASPINPTYGFTLELLELCTCMQVYGSMSLQTFSASILQMDSFLGMHIVKASASTLYRNLLHSVNEYRFHRTQLQRVGTLLTADLHSCGICSMDQTRSIISLDGNFGLVHKRRGEGLGRTRHNGLMFYPDEEVQEFVRKWAADKTVDEAGDALRSKNKTKKLDITGVFGSVCQHEFPGKMINLKHGERLSYAAFILQQLVPETSSEEKQLVMYDIACRFGKHLKARNSDLTNCFRFCVPAFHRFAHNLGCQLCIGQRYTVGAALHDGEGMERVWSFLRKFASASKQMTLENREDLLTDVLLAYSKRSFFNLGQKLKVQMEKALLLKEKSQKIFLDLEREIVPDTGGSAKEWLHAWQKELSDKEAKKVVRKLSTWQEYCYITVKHAEERCNVSSTTDVKAREKLELDIRRLEIQMLKLQHQLKLKEALSADLEQVKNGAKTAAELMKTFTLNEALTLAKERTFLQNLLTKYTNGQSIAARLGKQLQKNSSEVKTVQEKLTGLGISVTTSELLNIDSILYCTLSVGVTPLMQKAALARADYERAVEAEVQCRKDMELLLIFFLEKEHKLKSYVEHEAQTAEEKGIRHLLNVRLMVYYFVHEQCLRLFERFIDVSRLNLDQTLQDMPSPNPELDFHFDGDLLEISEDSDLEDM